MALLTEFWLLDLSTLLVTIFAGLYIFFKYSFSYWENRGIPFLKPSFPYGNVENLARKRVNFGIEIARKYQELKKFKERYGGFYMFNQPVLLIMDPDLAKNILIKEFNKFPDRGIYFNEVSVPKLLGDL